MIFLTVGTQFPFDRLVRAVDNILGQGLIDEEIFAQKGESEYQPHNLKAVDFLDKSQFDDRMRKASKIISHAGIGCIVTALNYNKPVLAMPRLKRYKEAVNDHQAAIARELEQSGHILVAHCTEELPAKLDELKTFIPQKRETQVEQMAQRIKQFFDGVAC